MTNADPFVIVAGFDGSKQSHDALQWAIEEARYRKAELRVLTVWNKAPMSWYPALLETAAGEVVRRRTLRSCRPRPSARRRRRPRQA